MLVFMAFVAQFKVDAGNDRLRVIINPQELVSADGVVTVYRTLVPATASRRAADATFKKYHQSVNSAAMKIDVLL
ncbi:hypothetical protein LOK49_LG10G00229 [Camellia lanceoleosa]|uniref:Uncharacterized protein n=1 Tax=Camellia lanceoleosa TaxID=1840588 RepID=A0ACC0GA90_9ERIC|nr:hypothetical protein LOK49_LG10G00229 [Camellia lanceoleosa]